VNNEQTLTQTSVCDQQREQAARQQWLEEFGRRIEEQFGEEDAFFDYVAPHMARARSNKKHAFTKWIYALLERTDCPLNFSPQEFLKAVYKIKDIATVYEFESMVHHLVKNKTLLIDLKCFGVDAVWQIPDSPENSAFVTQHWADIAVEGLPDLKPQSDRKGRRLRQSKAKVETPTYNQQRYRLVKKVAGGGRIPLHTLWMPVEVGDSCEARDGNWLNWTTTTQTTIIDPVVTSGETAWVRPAVATAGYQEKTVTTVPNIFITSSADNPAHTAAQEKFEKKSMRQFKVGKDEEGHEEVLVDAPPAKIAVNADLGKRTGTYGGRIVDCGHSRALSARERIDMGLQHDYHDVTLKAAIEGDEPTDKQRNDEALKAESVVPVHRYKADLDWNGRGVFRAENFITYAVNNLCFSFAPSCLFMTVIVETGKLT